MKISARLLGIICLVLALGLYLRDIARKSAAAREQTAARQSSPQFTPEQIQELIAQGAVVTNIVRAMPGYGFDDASRASTAKGLAVVSGMPVKDLALKREDGTTNAVPFKADASAILPLLASATDAELPDGKIEGTPFSMLLVTEHPGVIVLTGAIPDAAQDDAYLGFVEPVLTTNGPVPTLSSPALVPGLGAALRP